MSLIHPLRSAKKAIARTDLPAEAAINPVRQRRAAIAGAAEANWHDMEAYCDQVTAERDHAINRLEAAEILNARLAEREAALHKRLDDEKERYREALAAAMAAFNAVSPVLLDAYHKIAAVMGSQPALDADTLAEQIKNAEPLPSIVTRGPAPAEQEGR